MRLEDYIDKSGSVRDWDEWVSKDEYLKQDGIDAIKRQNKAFGSNLPTYGEFTKESQYVIDVFAGYIDAYGAYLNSHAMKDRPLLNRTAIKEAKLLIDALSEMSIEHISFNTPKGALRISDQRTVHAIMKAVAPILDQQQKLKTGRHGCDRSTYRQDFLVALCPLVNFLRDETLMKEYSIKDSCDWVWLHLIEPRLSRKIGGYSSKSFQNLKLDDMVVCSELLMGLLKKKENKILLMINV